MTSSNESNASGAPPQSTWRLVPEAWPTVRTPPRRLVEDPAATLGSCTVGTGEIRISDRPLTYRQVLDSVLIHELAHLLVADHGPEFESIVNRYPLQERATGYLMVVSDRLHQP